MSLTTIALSKVIPYADELEKLEAFVQEAFLHHDEDPSLVLAPGTLRRRALDAAYHEMQDGRLIISVEWRQRYALILGLERLLAQDTPLLADGTLLSAHQLDALSGTMVELLAQDLEAQGKMNSALSVDELDQGEDEEEGDEEAQEIGSDVVTDKNAHRRLWFEHATGAGKTVAAVGFVEAAKTGGVLILTHRRNLVDQFVDELKTRGYGKRIVGAMLAGEHRTDGPVTVETYQWFVRHAGNISDSYSVVICDEAHTALGEKTSACIREWTAPVFVGMTATGALIARHVGDLFPVQTSRFDLAQAARKGVISPLRCLRIAPGVGVRTIAKVPLRKGEVDQDFDQDQLAALLDQSPFNAAIADLYKARFNGLAGVVYSAGVQHAHNVANAFKSAGIKAVAVSGETPKRELASILTSYEEGQIDVLVNAQLLIEGWNSPRATVCMHLAPTASRRIYQQRVGRVTRRHPGKESGIVIDFVHPATTNDDPVVTLHGLLNRDMYRAGAVVIGPVRRGRRPRVKVEKRVLPTTNDTERRAQVLERELWRIAVDSLSWGEQNLWAALAGARAEAEHWQRAKEAIRGDKTGELARELCLSTLKRNPHPQLKQRAVQDIAASGDPEAFDGAVEEIRDWSKKTLLEAARVLLQAIAEGKYSETEQTAGWVWQLAAYSRIHHEQYAAQRWPETKRLLGLLANSSHGAHTKATRRIVHVSQAHEPRLRYSLLTTILTHTSDAEIELRSAKLKAAKSPQEVAAELLRNFPKKRGNRKRKGGNGQPKKNKNATPSHNNGNPHQNGNTPQPSGGHGQDPERAMRPRRRRRRRLNS